MNFPRRSARAHLQAQLIEVMPGLFRRLMVQMPNEVPGVGRVTLEQWGLLTMLERRGSATMGEIASHRNVALNTATAIVDRLSGGGLVERGHDLADRRVVRVAITEQGRDLVTALRERRREMFGQILDGLSEAEVDEISAAIPALMRLAGTPVPAEA